MFNNLFSKLTLSLLLVFILLGMLTVSVTFIASDLYQQEAIQKLNNQVATEIAKKADLLKDNQVNHKALKQLFRSLMFLNPGLEIYLLDHEGSILAFSAPAWKVVRMSVDMKPIKHYFDQQKKQAVRGNDPRDLNRNKYFSAAPVVFKDRPNGYVYVIVGGEEYDSIVDKIKASYILTSSFLVITVGLVIAFLAGILVFVKLTKRLKSLEQTVAVFESNPQVIPPFPNYRKKGDEIDRLSIAFQTMALKIHHQLDDLQTTDNLRRELVANVSHDLRTPLATLQGYIETLLLKDPELSAQQRIDYLETAIKHCKRLNKLVVELFELARLDASETKPQQEIFNLAELTEDIKQKFILKAQEKNIRIETEFASTETYVYADIGLIERVLENLLENALRFVDKAGTVTIALQGDEENIHIKVSDNGVGIPAAELPLIFDRFYQLDKNRNTENGSSGLGLAIVKRIVELHNSMINVNSVPGRYTTFSFSLPCHAD